MIRLRNVGHVYSDGSPWAHRALAGINLDLDAGSRLLVVGANGSGKSTLAWILAGLIAPSEGSATIDGTELATVRGAVAISFQHARLQLFRPTVAEDVLFGTEVTPRDGAAALRLVGLPPETFGPRRIDELSGGEQRRVALAGLLVRRPRLLVCDEPFAGLDRPGRKLLIDAIGSLASRIGTATVVVSHDVEDAARFADHVIELDAGRIAEARTA
jgi:energy-coupling factor transport system ATP-binding protein